MMPNIRNQAQKIVAIVTVAVVLLPSFASSVSALSAEDLHSIYNDSSWYKLGGTIQCGTTGLTVGGGLSGGSYTLDQVKTFLSTPITSTWNISDSTVEQWFLKQSGARATITKYGLTSGNIGTITSVVKAANVSPVLFYLYTVNEGGGAGGFINHYGSDIPGGGPANAARDAEYLATTAQQTNGTPASGGGEPADMPTAEAKAILDSLPAGSVGVAYIQATSAATAELEDLSGKTGAWTGLFGKPLSASMQNIQSMGGDPSQGGTSGCTNGVAGQGMSKAINWAVMIANNNGYGYDQPTRATGWVKWQSDPNCTNQCGSFDCSSFVSAALTEAGYFGTNPNFSTFNEASSLTGAGFTNVTSSVSLDTGANLQPGDILLNTASHTAMYIGNGQVVAASINESGQTAGGQVGDQNGKEIHITQYYNYPWDSVWRAPS